MKKIVISLIMVLICTVSLNAQKTKYFNLTPNWLVSTQDSTKNYIIIPFDSLTTSEIYNKILNYTHLVPYSTLPISEIKDEVENKFIKFEIEDKLNTIMGYNFSYTVIISVDENRTKIKFYDLIVMIPTTDKKDGTLYFYDWTRLLLTGVLFKQGKKQNEKQIETYFNNKVDEIISGIQRY